MSTVASMRLKQKKLLSPGQLRAVSVAQLGLTQKASASKESRYSHHVQSMPKCVIRPAREHLRYLSQLCQRNPRFSASRTFNIASLGGSTMGNVFRIDCIDGEKTNYIMSLVHTLLPLLAISYRLLVPKYSHSSSATSSNASCVACESPYRLGSKCGYRR